MSFKNKLKEAYSQKVTAPKGYIELEEKVEVKETHHYLFKSLKLTGLFALASVGVFVLAIGATVLISGMRINENVADSVKKARFSMYDTNLIESETFKYLNSITYDAAKADLDLNPEFITYVNNFAEKTYSGFDKTNNFAYSPLMVYTQMDLISLALSTPETINEMNTALGTEDTALRGRNVCRAMMNNSYADKEQKSTVQTKNAVFFDKERALADINSTFLEGLTNRHAEVYGMSFDSAYDVNNILKWIDQSVNEDNYITKEDLDIKDDTFIAFISSLYFDNAWQKKYVTKDTKDDTFYLSDGSTVTTKFMNHTIFTEFKDFGDYVSVTDYYYYKYGYNVEYFVPKKIEDNIFNLLSVDFLTKEPVEKRDQPVSLSMPKFEAECKNEITDIVKGAGIEKMYESTGNCLENAVESSGFLYSYIQHTKQKTTVSFDEDGTVVKTITFSLGAGGTATAPGSDVNLNQPFVYCIKDRSGLPLVLGAITNPTK